MVNELDVKKEEIKVRKIIKDLHPIIKLRKLLNFFILNFNHKIRK